MEQENERAVPLRRTIDSTAADASRGRPRKTWQLAPPWRKLLLAIHIIVSVGLLGTDAAVLVLASPARAVRPQIRSIQRRI